MNSHQRRKFVKATMSELRKASASELELGLIDAAEDYIKQEKRIEQLERQLAERDAEIAKYRDAPVVAYYMDEVGEGDDIDREYNTIDQFSFGRTGGIPLIVKPGEQ